MRMMEKENIFNKGQPINLISLIFVMSLFLVGGFFVLKISGLAISNSEKDLGIVAMVDPTIYKPGDTSLTIYGACLNSISQPVTSTANITIYNGSGSTWASGSMTSITTGRFRYNTTGPTTTGNYFVEINCSANGQWVLAYSNFQVKKDVQWAGYTATTTGDLNGTVGANAYCNNTYKNSHWCTAEEILKLGTDYPNTYTIWLPAEISYTTCDSYCRYIVNMNPGTTYITHTTYTCPNDADCIQNVAQYTQCNNWNAENTHITGTCITTSGPSINQCNTLNRLPCCY